MKEAKAQTALETWTAPEASISVESAASVLEEISAYALEGLKQLSRSGIAVGGVLFGSRREKLVRIVTWRPIPCEHVKGSAFILSQADRKGLALLLQDPQPDPQLTGLHAIGWFVSHTREGVSLNQSDSEIYSHFFPWSWQIALVLRPFRDRPTVAGFFVRDGEGRVKTDASQREFQIAGSGAPNPRTPHYPVIAEYEHTEEETPAGELETSEEAVDDVRTRVGPARSFGQARIFSDRRLWIWAVPVMLALIVWAVVLEKPAPPPVSPSLGFHLSEANGQLRLEWDQSSTLVEEATRGTLNIRDGAAAPLRVELQTNQLDAGSYSYTRKSADVEVVFTVFPQGSKPVAESARFVGTPVSLPHTDDAAELRRQRDVLAREYLRLKDELRRETNRNRDLEDAIRALKNRVEVERSQKAK